MLQLLNIQLYDNSVQSWGAALVTALVVGGVLTLARAIVLSRFRTLVERTATDVDDLVLELVRRTRAYFLWTLALYAGTLVLSLPLETRLLIRTLVLTVVFIQAALWGVALVNYFVIRQTRKDVDQSASSETTIRALGIVAKVVVWTVVILLILDNIPNVEVGALLASLGVGGVAVALAVQNILGDLFASLSIVLDQPFAIGDHIVVGDYKGTVENIGLKSTRVRSLSGEQLVFANSDLLESRIRNFKRMNQRRVAFNLGIAYETPAEVLAQVPDLVKEIIEAQPETTFDRCHLKELGDSAAVYETVYYLLTPDYSVYMDVQQAINLTILKRFEELGIEMPYPTQAVILERK